MKRRQFVQMLAAAALASGPFANQARKLADDLSELRDQLASANNERQFWNRVKSSFSLDRNITHLNCGSIGACPTIVTEALVQFARMVESNPFEHLWGSGLNEQLEPMRQTAAKFLGADTGEVTVIRNTTEGMNLLAQALDLNPGDEVLTSNHEHAGGMVGWQHLAKYKGVRVTCVELPSTVKDQAAVVGAIRQHISPRTKVFSFCHIDTITGTVLPVESIAKMAHEQGAYFVCDGAQGPGMLPVDVHRLGVDAYVSSSHKWLLAPKGSGLLYISRRLQSALQSMELSSGMRCYSASMGTRDVAKILAHGVAIDFQNMIGQRKIARRIRHLNAYLSDRLEELDGLHRLTCSKDAGFAGIVTVALDPKFDSSSDVAAKLAKAHRIYVKPAQATYSRVPGAEQQRRDYNALRFSTQIFNDEGELDRAVDVLEQLMGPSNPKRD